MRRQVEDSAALYSTGASSSSAAESPAQERNQDLSDRDLAVLAFERKWWRHAASKEQAIRERFSISSARYYQLLGHLIDSPAALAFDPMLINRLRRLRDARRSARAARMSEE